MDVTWKSKLPEKIMMIIQIPSNSVRNQIIEIGGSDYLVNYISGISLADNDFQKDSILTVYGNLSSNKLYIPSFPSVEAKQEADYTEVNNRIDLEILNRENIGIQLNQFKIETSNNFTSTNNRITELRENIKEIAREEFAPIESARLSGNPTTPTPEEGDTSQKIASTEYVMRAIASLINSSPDSLNTLAELSQALNNDPNFARTVTDRISQKLDKTGGFMTGTLQIINDNTVISNQYNRPALTLGGTQSEAHLEIGANQIQSKSSDKSVAVLVINEGGGLTVIGSGGLRIEGDLEVSGNIISRGTIESEKEITAPEFNGIAKTALVAYNLPEGDVGGNIWLVNNYKV